MLCLYFSDLIESLFTYMIFETLKLKPYFVKEVNDPKKQKQYLKVI